LTEGVVNRSPHAARWGLLSPGRQPWPCLWHLTWRPALPDDQDG